MKVTTNQLKKMALALITLPLLATLFLNSASVPSRAASEGFDPTAFYKAKCAMCHGAKVDKNFDATKADDQLVEAVLKGVKPKMPEYGSKGVDAEQAKALVTYMKQLKATTAEPSK